MIDAQATEFKGWAQRTGVQERPVVVLPGYHITISECANELFGIIAPKKEVFSHSYVVFSPDGAVLASGEYGRTGGILAVYEVSTGKELQQLGEQTYGFTCAAFSPDSSLLATGSIGGAVHLFGAAPAKQEFLERQTDRPTDRKLRPRHRP